MLKLKRLLQYKPSLRHGAFDCIDQKQHAVDHFENPFNLAAKIGVSGGVYYVYFDIFIMRCRVFRKDSNASFPFQIIAVHYPLADLLVKAKNTALLQHLVHKRRLAVVNMCNYRYIS